MMRPCSFVLKTFAVLWALAATLASAQHFQAVPNSYIPFLSAGGTSVWGVNGNQPYRYNPTTDHFDLMPGTIHQISAGGGTTYQPDEVWGIYNSLIYRFNNTTQAFDQVPGRMRTVVVGIGYDACHPYEVWGVDINSLAYRFDFCALHFEEIAALVTRVFTGGGQVWAFDDTQQACRFNPAVNGFDFCTSDTFVDMAVGAQGVWAMPFGGPVERFDPVSQSFVNAGFGNNFVVAGGDGLWGGGFGGVYRMVASTGQQVTISGNEYAPMAVYVGSGTGVWITSYSFIVYRFVNP